MRYLSKALLYVVFFSVLHFGYEFTELPFLKPFCGIDESVFEHIKMGFWAYLITSIIEYFFSRKRVEAQIFWYSRLFSTILVPWSIVIVWYMAPAFFGHVESITLELMWAFTVVIVSGIVGIMLEKTVERVSLSSPVRMIILVLFVMSVIFYVRFSFSKPWIDLFIDPLSGG
ncbi:DUF6512 family protein [Pseudothermotoga sp. U03pept]|uniref:DUF6512 family protein n=1 Tax=Pseudothermotoga sp. U03pept TaxID=3447012 RepID=UPI003F091188